MLAKCTLFLEVCVVLVFLQYVFLGTLDLQNVGFF